MIKKIRIPLLGTFLFIILATGIPGSVWGQLRFLSAYPFRIGEGLVFDVRALGTYLGEQVISIDSETAFDGYQLIKGSASIQSGPLVSAFYDLNDTEVSYFFPEDLTPYYNEKWIHEGSWIDQMAYEFDPDSGVITVNSEQAGGVLTEITAPVATYNYFTLILAIRSLDYDYYIDGGHTISISYLMGETLQTSTLSAEYDSQRFQGERVDTIRITDTQGFGLEFILTDDESRLPLELQIPSDPNSGNGLDMKVKLIEYSPGSTEIQTTGQ